MEDLVIRTFNVHLKVRSVSQEMCFWLQLLCFTSKYDVISKVKVRLSFEKLIKSDI